MNAARTHLRPSDRVFVLALIALGGVYVLTIGAMLGAMALAPQRSSLFTTLQSEPIRRALVLSLLTSTLSTIIALWLGVPTAYILSRWRFPGRRLLDAVVDIPIALPPIVVGIALLLVFRSAPGRWFESHAMGVTYEIPAIVLAQTVIATAFCVRTLRASFDQCDPRAEGVARTLGMSRAQAFFNITLPQARPGLLAGATIAWARSLGEFGPVLVFAGATRMHTEVLPTSIYMELSVGNLGEALSVSLLMVALALAGVLLTRLLGASTRQDRRP